MPTLTLDSIELPTGVRLQYAEQGDRSGVPVVMLHGWSDSWRSFEPILPHLPDSIHGIALTQRGHGDSERPARGYRIDDFAADAVALIEALELGPTVVVGHSLGTWVASRIAIGHRESVAGVVLAGAPGPPARNEAISGFVAEEVVALTDPVPREFAHAFQESTIAGPLPEGVLEGFVDDSLKMRARVWKDIAAGFMQIDYTDQLPSIAAPTLLVWGDQDVFTSRAEQDHLTSHIPHSRLVVYEGVGHAVHWEEPQRFAADVAAFAGGEA